MISKLWMPSTKEFDIKDKTISSIRTIKVYDRFNENLLFYMKSRYWKYLDEKYLSIDVLFVKEDQLIGKLLNKINKTIKTFTKYVNETTIECLCDNKQILDEHFDFKIIKE